MLLAIKQATNNKSTMNILFSTNGAGLVSQACRFIQA
jgi:hypothetical protein